MLNKDTANSTFLVIDNSGSPLAKHIGFSPNDIVFLYFDHPVIFHNLYNIV